MPHAMPDQTAWLMADTQTMTEQCKIDEEKRRSYRRQA